MKYVARSVWSRVPASGYARMFSGGGSTTSTQKTDPWAGSQPYILQGLQGAGNLYTQGGPQYYPNSTYANPTQGQLQGLQQTVETGLNGTPAQSGANNTLQSFFDPNYTNSNPSNPAYSFFANGGAASADNPYFKQMADRTTADVLPRINASFANGNRSDSGLAARAQSLGLGDAIGSLAYNNYQQGLGQQLQGAAGLSGNYTNAQGQRLSALGQAPGINDMTFNNLNRATGAGTAQQTINQNIIADAMARWNFMQQQPYSNLSNFIGNVQGNAVSGTGSSQKQEPYFNSPMSNILSGISGVGALNNMGMFGSTGLGGLIGSFFQQ